MTNKYAEQAPKEITVKFQYESRSKKPYYALVTPDASIEMVELESIYRFLDENDSCVTNKSSIQYWEPTQHGWELVWRLSGEEFLERATLEAY
jgi:hypothetical protein